LWCLSFFIMPFHPWWLDPSLVASFINTTTLCAFVSSLYRSFLTSFWWLLIALFKLHDLYDLLLTHHIFMTIRNLNNLCLSHSNLMISSHSTTSAYLIVLLLPFIFSPTKLKLRSCLVQAYSEGHHSAATLQKTNHQAGCQDKFNEDLTSTTTLTYPPTPGFDPIFDSVLVQVFSEGRHSAAISNKSSSWVSGQIQLGLGYDNQQHPFNFRNIFNFRLGFKSFLKGVTQLPHKTNH
jgi:hypothetical protein